MGKLKRRGGKGTLGGSRRAGPVGAEEDPLAGRSAGELVIDDFDPLEGTWKRLGTHQAVFARVAKGTPKKDDRLRLDARIKEFPKIRPANEASTRGSTGIELYIEFGLEEKKDNKFNVYYSRIVLKAVISVMVRSQFEKLSEFKKHYDEFRALVDKSSRAAALAAFASRHAKSGSDHAATDFRGVRAKTVLHEVKHVRHAESEAEAVLDNLMDELKKEGRKKHWEEPRVRITRWLGILLDRWHTDVGGKVHDKIIENDCRFMIALYEYNKLTEEQAAEAGNNNPQAELDKANDVLAILLMDLLGERFPWDS